MISRQASVGLIAIVLAPQIGYTEEPLPIIKSSSYQDVKTWHEQFMQGQPTKAQRLEAVREIVRTSNFGDRGLNSIYKNFDGKYSLDTTIPGIEKSALLTRSASASQAKGYRRELLYAVSLHNDPRYSVVEMNRPQKRSWGNTDFDIVFKHHSSNQYGRIEVKDYSPDSQTTNLAKLKTQIDKMAREGRYSGQPQLWINARPVVSDVRSYAESRGVLVLENVKTGTKASKAPGAISADVALGQVDQHIKRAVNTRTMIAAGQLGFGAWMLLGSAPMALESAHALLNEENGGETTQWLRFGEQASYAAAGTGMVLSSGISLASRYASEANQARLFSTGRYVGQLAWVGLVAAEGFQIARYSKRDVSDREFWTNQWVLGSAATGGYFGSLAGGALAGFVFKAPPAVAAGSVTGGSGGAWLGESLARSTANAWYEHKFAGIDERFGKRVYARYGLQ